MTARRALLLACGRFDDPELPALRSPGRDAAAFKEVLSSLDYEVSTVTDCGVQEARRAIAVFLEGARRTDVNLIYFSCHGIQDPDGNLYFAFSDSQYSMPDVSAVPADFVRHRISSGRSRSTILIIDCCFSGAFLHGMQAKAGRSAGVDALVRDMPEGSGVAVLTSSGATEVSLEDPGNRGEAARRGSYFTEAVITGLVTGAADRDRDGRITVDELFSYASDRVADGPSRQKPRKFVNAVGEMVVATVGARTTEPPPPTPPPTSADTVLIAPDVLAPWPPLPAKPRPTAGPTSSDPRRTATAPTSPAPRHTATAPTSPAPRHTATAPTSAAPRHTATAPTSPVPRHSAAVPVSPAPRRPAPAPPASGGAARPAADGGANLAAQSRPFASAPTVYGRKRRTDRRLPALVATAVLLTAGVVAFVASRGGAGVNPPVSVPSVEGLSRAAAEAKLREAKLTPRSRPTAASGGGSSTTSCRAGTVTDQSPDAGTRAGPGTAVDYELCPDTTVPTLTGLTEKEADAALVDAGLVAKKATSRSRTCARPEVISQKPEPGAAAARGNTVTFTMCPRKASATTTTPDSSGSTTTSEPTPPCPDQPGTDVAPRASCPPTGPSGPSSPPRDDGTAGRTTPSAPAGDGG